LGDESVLLEPHRHGGGAIEDLLDAVNLDEVLASAEGAELLGPERAGNLANLARVGVVQAPSFFGPDEVILLGHVLP